METRYTIEAEQGWVIRYFEYSSLDCLLFVRGMSRKCLTTTLRDDYILGVF